jgi:cytochrome c-type biogenesis protein CcmH/NrfG
MRKQVEESPLDARFPLFLGILYEAYGLSDQAKLAYEHALSLSTKKQNIMYQLAQNAIQRGDVQGAIRHLDAAYALDTNNQEAAVIYAATLIRVGKTADAERLLAPFVERGYAADPRILAAYKETKQIGRAIPLWEALVRVNPGEPQSYFTLAAIHYLAGNSAAAIAILEDVKLAVPKTTGDADTVIQQIRTGSAVAQ